MSALISPIIRATVSSTQYNHQFKPNNSVQGCLKESHNEIEGNRKIRSQIEHNVINPLTHEKFNYGTVKNELSFQKKSESITTFNDTNAIAKRETDDNGQSGQKHLEDLKKMFEDAGLHFRLSQIQEIWYKALDFESISGKSNGQKKTASMNSIFDAMKELRIQF